MPEEINERVYTQRAFDTADKNKKREKAKKKLVIPVICTVNALFVVTKFLKQTFALFFRRRNCFSRESRSTFLN